MDFDNDPNYEKVAEGEYKDLRTGNTLMVLDEEVSLAIRKVLNIPDDVEVIDFTEEMLNTLIENLSSDHQDELS